VTVATIGDRTLAFVGLERGGGGVMVYDVTDISNVQFVTYARNAADVSPEGLTYVAAEDSPTGQALLAVTNELSLSLSVYGLTRIVHGDENSNVLASVAGVDELTGGAGKDFFDFNKVGDIGTAASIRDVITDFTQRVDKIDLSTIDANILKEGDQKFNWAPALSGKAGQLVVEQNEGVTLVMGDVNGDAIADFTIELLGVPRLTPQDIIF
jgi:Ca2+-binding RTX toxin-like protein